MSLALLLSIGAIALTILVPAGVEWAKRPRLVVKPGHDANSDDPYWRIVHVRVVNLPGLLHKLILRSQAAGCSVKLEFVSCSDNSKLSVEGKWSGRPEPLTAVPNGYRYDPQMILPTRILDVSPNSYGEAVAVAIKHNGDAVAYADRPELYENGNLRSSRLALPHERYDVTVTARAGDISSKPTCFRLDNDGVTPRDLRLRPI